MREISFENFKCHCSSHYNDYDLDVESACAMEDPEPGARRILGVVDGKTVYYRPCCEKACPVLSNCKKVNR